MMIDARGVQYNPEQPQLDITAPQGEVQVEIDHYRNVIYVHVGGVMVFRMCRITGKIIIEEDA